MDEAIKRTKGSVILTIVTACISAYVAVSVARENSKTEIAKATISTNAIGDRLTKLEDYAARDVEYKGKISGYLEQQNKLLELVFTSQAGIKAITLPIPPIKTYGEVPGKDRPPTRTVTRKRIAIPPPKEATAQAARTLKSLRQELP